MGRDSGWSLTRRGGRRDHGGAGRSPERLEEMGWRAQPPTRGASPAAQSLWIGVLRELLGWGGWGGGGGGVHAHACVCVFQ